jgi:carboxynorspermidine decarboxylase
MIKSKTFQNFDPRRVPSPCFVVDEAAVEKNLQVLNKIQQQSGAKILLALKAFSMFSLAPLVSQYLSGICASGLYEARLGREEFKGEVHTFSPAFTEKDLTQVLKISDHVVFNSFQQCYCLI